MDSGVAELSALLTECESINNRLETMTSSYSTIDTLNRSGRRSSVFTTIGDLDSSHQSSSTDNDNKHQMKLMLKQTKDEFNRLMQDVRSSKSTVELKQNRLKVLWKEFNEIYNTHETIKSQYEMNREWKENVDELKILLNEIVSKQSQLNTIINNGKDLGDTQLIINSKRLVTQFELIQKDMMVK
ncbi:unnamed protein product [Didymodactylos carnosus]|uniref:Uncharacterized protein n=1 Tax=Didymodactylos carnosus TaxID=1234261 RepID=A0A8S2XEQ7_9BILA|nr:unnamed protein product [Didymodactylos carnosus]CAF4493617.1 unnamed protein product [Didymodactylos carnosus]